MVAAHLAWLHTESELMIDNERRRDLALLYPLIRTLPSGLAPLVKKLSQHITQQGLQAIGNLQGENVTLYISFDRFYFPKFIVKILQHFVFKILFFKLHLPFFIFFSNFIF